MFKNRTELKTHKYCTGIFHYNIFSSYFSGTTTNEPKVNLKENAFQVFIEPGNLYGPANGVYVVRGIETARTMAQKSCLAGFILEGSSYYEGGFPSNPSKQQLATYSCGVTPPIIG